MAYNHFKERLKERYGLEITPLEYIELITSQVLVIKDLGSGKNEVKVQFKGVVIRAIKQKNKNKFLITALPAT